LAGHREEEKYVFGRWPAAQPSPESSNVVVQLLSVRWMDGDFAAKRRTASGIGVGGLIASASRSVSSAHFPSLSSATAKHSPAGNCCTNKQSGLILNPSFSASSPIFIFFPLPFLPSLLTDEEMKVLVIQGGSLCMLGDL
jgi:hypothetical protein